VSKKPNEKYLNLVEALVFPNFEKVKEITSAKDFSTDILTSDLSTEDIPYPIFYIPIFVKIACSADMDYSNIICVRGQSVKTSISLAADGLKNINKIIDYLSKTFDIDFDVEIPYWQYKSLFFPERFGFVSEEDETKYIKNGFRAIDIDLYNAGRDFDMHTVEQLLEIGADPNTYLMNGEILSEEIINWEHFVLTFMHTPLHERKSTPNVSDLCSLMTWAAIEVECALFDKYRNQKLEVFKEQKRQQIIALVKEYVTLDVDYVEYAGMENGYKYFRVTDERHISDYELNTSFYVKEVNGELIFVQDENEQKEAYTRQICMQIRHSHS